MRGSLRNKTSSELIVRRGKQDLQIFLCTHLQLFFPFCILFQFSLANSQRPVEEGYISMRARERERRERENRERQMEGEREGRRVKQRGRVTNIDGYECLLEEIFRRRYGEFDTGMAKLSSTMVHSGWKGYRNAGNTDSQRNNTQKWKMYSSLQKGTAANLKYFGERVVGELPFRLQLV